jgi:eukaryotic-like serine/threonine-protein kinase
MNSDPPDMRWQRIDELFTAALKREGTERDAFIAQSCQGDDALRQEIESLLKAHTDATGFMQSTMFNEAVELITESDENRDPQERIGPYKLVKEIGRGGMGAVYLAARDDLGGRRVALKLVKRGMDTDFILHRFYNERITLSGLDHPNIARLIDGGATGDGLPYFAMDYIEGLSIDEYCDTHRLSTAERLQLFCKVCSAVQYAHQHLVVHRDLKPGNILVTPDGNPKLLDFGIAKLLGDEGLAATVTSLTLRIMTPDYASPEQVRGEVVTTSSDVYSLGVLLYELLSGHSPYHFESRSPDEIAQAITNKEPEKLSRVISRVERVTTGKRAGTTITLKSVSETREGHPEKLRRRLRGDLDNIVSKALRKEPARRYVSVAEFSEDIRRHLEGLPVIARRDTFGYRAGKFIRRNKIAVGAGVVAALLLAAGIFAIGWEAHVAKAQRATAERRLDDVRKLAHRMLFDYSDSIKDLAGSTPVREKMVGDALEYVDRLAKEAAGDPSLQRELAAAYEKVASVQAVYRSLGRTIAAAIEGSRKALRIRETIVAADPADVSAQTDLANSYRIFSNLLWFANDTAGALQTAGKALSIREQLAAANPANLERRFDVAQSSTDIGQMFEEQGNFAEAMTNFRRARTLSESVMTTAPDNPKYRGMVAVVYFYTLVDMVQTGDDPDQAIKLGQQAVTMFEKLSAESPERYSYRHLQAGTLHWIGCEQLSLCDFSGALESFRKQLAVLGPGDPTNAESRDVMAKGLLFVAITLDNLNRTADGLEDARKAVSIRQELAKADPENSWKRWYLIQAAAATARLTAKAGERKDALEACKKTRALLEIKTDDPTNASQARERMEAYLHLAEAYVFLASDKKISLEERQQQWATARELYEQSFEVWAQLQRNNALPAGYARTPDQLAREIARCDAALAAK